MVNPMDVRALFSEESENEKLLSSGAKSLSNLQLPCARPGLRRAQADLLGQKRHKEGELPVFFPFEKLTFCSQQRVATPMENRKRKYGADASKFSSVPKK